MQHALLIFFCLFGQTVVPSRPEPAKRSMERWPSAAGLVPGPSYGTGRTAGGFVVPFGDLVLRGREDPTRGLETYLATSGKRIAEIAFASLWENKSDRMVIEHFASGTVVLMGDGDLVALEPRTLRPRWHSRLVPREEAVKWNGPELGQAYSAGAHIVAVLRSSGPKVREIVVLAAASGDIVWRQQLKRVSDPAAIAVAGQRVAWVEDEKIVAARISDGRRLWTTELPAGQTTLVANDQFVVAEVGGADHSDLIVLDASTGGGLRREVLPDANIHQVAIDGETLVLGRAAASTATRSEDIVYETRDMRTGRVLWRARPVPGWMANRPRILFDADAVIVNNGSGLVYAFNRETGGLIWFWGLHPSDEVDALAHPTPGKPGILLLASHEGVQSFVRSSRPSPPYTATFFGRVLDQRWPVGGAVVVANFVRTISKPNGSYRISTPGRGLVKITAIGPRGGAAEHVDPKTARPFKLDLNVSPRCGEKCEAPPRSPDW